MKPVLLAPVLLLLAPIAPAERIAAIVRAGIEEGTFRPDLAPLAAGQTLMALAMGLLLQAFLDPHWADWGQATLESVKILIRGFENR